MSYPELNRLEVFQRIKEKRLKQADAVTILNLSLRQVKRLYSLYKKFGPPSLISKKRGNQSNNKLPEAIREQILLIVRNRYYDFDPTLASEKLAEEHNIHISKESMRKIMMDNGIWICRDRCHKRAYQPA